MSLTADKSHHPAAVVQQKTTGSAFFRKAAGDAFFGAQESRSFFTPGIQAKLEVSHPDDPQEKEADAVAGEVMRMAESAGHDEPQRKEREEEKAVSGIHRQAQPEEKEKVHAKLSGIISRQGNPGGFASHAAADEDSGTTAEIQAKGFPYQAPPLTRSARGPPSAEASSPAPTFVQSLSASQGGGRSLPDDVRTNMEGRFGADFSGVRIHTGTSAENLSGSISAQAFTHGNDIYFNSGKYSPNTAAGGALLAHELTHTIQQGSSHPKSGSIAAKFIQRKINRSVQRQEAGSQRNAAVALAKGEQGKVSANAMGPDGYRMGWERLLEYFKTTFGADKILPEGSSGQPGTVSEANIKKKSYFKGDVPGKGGIGPVQHNQDRDAMPSWCGIFAFWALNKGGVPLKKWTLGSSMIPPEAAYPGGYQPQAGDLAYRQEYSHYALVASSDGANVTSINGNTAGPDNMGGEVQIQTHPKDHWFAYFNPTLIMEGALRDPGSPESPSAAPVKSLKEVRERFKNVHRKAETQTEQASDADNTLMPAMSAPGTRSAESVSASTSAGAASAAPSVATAVASENPAHETSEEMEQEQAVPASREFEIHRSMENGPQHESQAPPVPRFHENASAPSLAARPGAETSPAAATSSVHRKVMRVSDRGPPRAAPAIQALVHRKLVQRGWLGDAWNAVSGMAQDAAAWVEKGLDKAKDWLFEKITGFVRDIPGLPDVVPHSRGRSDNRDARPIDRPKSA